MNSKSSSPMKFISLFNALWAMQLYVHLFPIEGEITSHAVQERKYNIHAVRNKNSCDSSCWDGNNCASDNCAECFFSCPKQTCRRQRDSCNFWCSKKSDCSTSTADCGGCVFCHNVDVTATSCTLATFGDVTSTVFGSGSELWNTWKHSGLPYFHEGVPILFDIDGDNILDYFNPMHGHTGPFEKRMELGIGRKNGPHSNYTLQNFSERIICTDAEFLEQYIDTHESALIDLDGDGILDIYISNGGGQFVVEPEYYSSYDNWLFWGEIRKDASTGKEITVFVGGRDAARAAGVEMKLGRARFNYFFDANGDGLPDMFSSQDRRVSNIIKPGILLINQGDRTWKENNGLREYSRAMMVTDADGDGFANEFILNRSHCYPQRAGPGVDKSQPRLGPFANEVKAFCNTRPVGTNAVYRYNQSSEIMEEISKPYRNFWAGSKWTNPCCLHGAYDDGGDGCNAISMVSGDFDNDQVADHTLLYAKKLVFFFSSDRPRGALPDSTKYVGLEIRLPDYCSRAFDLQIVDIDNNGKEELLVSCINPGLYLFYTQGSSQMNWTLQDGCNQKGALGALNNRFLAYPKPSEMDEFCDIYYGSAWGVANTACKQYQRKKSFIFTKSTGVAIYDWNNDGYYDIVSSNSFGHLRFFNNKTPTTNALSHKFICFKLIGDVRAVDTPSNNNGIGATIILHTKNQTGKWVKQFRELHYGAKDDRIIFGLGQNLRPKKVEVRWPNGKVQLLKLQGWEFSKVLDPIEIMYTEVNSNFKLQSQHPDLGYLCLGTGQSIDNKLRMKKCGKWKSMRWTMNPNGRISTQRFEGYCLITETSAISNGTKVVLGTGRKCNSSSWFLTSSKKLKYGASSFGLDFDAKSFEARLWPLADERQESKWKFD